MQATQEQQEIISGVQQGKDMIINAFAGAGKTSVLIMIAEAYPERRGIYLAYNRSIADEARSKFPPHIQCITTHSLAYQAIGKHFKAKLQQRLTATKVLNYFNVESLIEEQEGHYPEISALQIAGAALSITQQFEYSNDDALDIKHLPLEIVAKLQKNLEKEYGIKIEFESERFLHPETLLEQFAFQAYSLASRLWQEMVNPKNHQIGIRHDTYLKLYQLSKPKIDGDYLMMDEAQDANPTTLALILNQSMQKIFVGDHYQSIYAFRGSVNAMQQVQGARYYLTQSFRFGEAIADVANIFLKKLDEKRKLKGFNQIKSVNGINNIDESQPYTIISRTNAGLLNQAITLILKNKNVAIVGGLGELISQIESAFALWQGETSKIKSPLLRYYRDWNAFQHEIEHTKDADLTAIYRFIDQFQLKSLDYLELLKKNQKDQLSHVDVVLTTAHKSKGCEWKQVLLNEDFNELGHPLCTKEELRLWYVTVTRAINVLDLRYYADLPDYSEEDLPVSKPLPPAPKKTVAQISRPPKLTMQILPYNFSEIDLISRYSALVWQKAQDYRLKQQNKCEVCTAPATSTLNIYLFDKDKEVATLNKLQALCDHCKSAKDFFTSLGSSERDIAIRQHMAINHWNRKQLWAYYEIQQEQANHYSRIHWHLDSDLFEQQYAEQIKAARAEIIAKEKAKEAQLEAWIEEDRFSWKEFALNCWQVITKVWQSFRQTQKAKPPAQPESALHRQKIQLAQSLLHKIHEKHQAGQSLGYLLGMLRRADPYAFEELLLICYQRQGYQIFRNNAYSGDGGIDGKVISPDGELFIIQAKRYKNAIKPQHMRDFAALVEEQHASGLFIHTGRTGKQSYQAASNQSIKIISGNRLLSLVLNKKIIA